jgi:hypothetical protein
VFDTYQKGLIDSLYAKLFTELTAQRGNALFALFELAAREFPQAGECMITRALRDQDTAITVKKDSRGYVSLP